MLGFNITGTNSLNLSREHVVGIYNGSITHWNDSVIQELNPGFKLPGERIKVVARSDKSGTTEIFTSALSSFSAEWANAFGTFSSGLNSDRRPAKWNEDVISFYGFTNKGISGILLSIDYTVAYIYIYS